MSHLGVFSYFLSTTSSTLSYISGKSHGTHYTPFPTSVLAFASTGIKLSYWCICNLPHTALHAATRRTRRLLRSLWMLMDLFQALIWTRTNTHVIPSDTLLVVHFYMYYRIDIPKILSILVSIYPENTTPNTIVSKPPVFLIWEFFLRSHAVSYICLFGNQAKYLVSCLFVTMGQCLGSARGFRMNKPSVLYTQRFLYLHSVLYRHRIRLFFQTYAKSRVWSIRHWGGEADSNR